MGGFQQLRLAWDDILYCLNNEYFSIISWIESAKSLRVLQDDHNRDNKDIEFENFDWDMQEFYLWIVEFNDFYK